MRHYEQKHGPINVPKWLRSAVETPRGKALLAIAKDLEAVDPVWRDAWFRCLVTVGRYKGLIRKGKPNGSDPEAGLMWEAWQLAKRGFPNYGSIGGAMCSSMYCSRADKADAFDVALDSFMKLGE